MYRLRYTRQVLAGDPYALAFATDVRAWKKKGVRANVLNKSNARAWFERLEAIGGASKESLAEVGLMGAADIEAGKVGYAELSEYMLAKGESTPNESGRVEMLENMLNEYI